MVASSILFEPFRFLLKEAASAGILDSDATPFLASDTFPSAIKFVKRFTNLKSICIHFPSYVNVVAVVDDNGVSLFKWKIKFGTRVDSFVIPSPNSEDVLEEEEEKDKDSDEYFKAYSCLMDVIDRFKKVLGCTAEFPQLEKVYIMDSDKRGIVTLSGGEIDELRNVTSLFEMAILQRTQERETRYLEQFS